MSQLKENLYELFHAADNSICSSFIGQDISEGDSEWDDAETKEFKFKLQALEISFNCESSYGGEGEGEAFWAVYSFTNGTDLEYIKFNGYYASYSGSEFQEWFFVEPKTVEVVQYVEV
jgi:hypothetical protein